MKQFEWTKEKPNFPKGNVSMENNNTTTNSGGEI